MVALLKLINVSQKKIITKPKNLILNGINTMKFQTNFDVQKLSVNTLTHRNRFY